MSANNKNRITKKDQYLTLLDVISYSEQNGFENETIDYNELRDFINHEIELLDNKTVAAQKRAAVKKQKGDALRDEIFNLLSDTEYMTIDQILEAINNPDVKRNMVVARLAQLGDSEKGLGLVEKEMVSPADGSKGSKIAAYKQKVQ